MAYGASTYGQTTGAAKGLRFLKLFSPQNDPFANNLIGTNDSSLGSKWTVRQTVILD